MVLCGKWQILSMFQMASCRVLPAFSGKSWYLIDRGLIFILCFINLNFAFTGLRLVKYLLRFTHFHLSNKFVFSFCFLKMIYQKVCFDVLSKLLLLPYRRVMWVEAGFVLVVLLCSNSRSLKLANRRLFCGVLFCPESLIVRINYEELYMTTLFAVAQTPVKW